MVGLAVHVEIELHASLKFSGEINVDGAQAASPAVSYGRP